MFVSPATKKQHQLVEEFLAKELTLADAEKAEQRLLARWYPGEADFGIYDSEDWLIHYLRYLRYTANFTRSAGSFLKRFGHAPTTILDHGTGLGFNALIWEDRFPEAKILATNTPGIQLEFNRFLKEKTGTRVEFIDEEKLDAAHFDLVSCFEVFEHFEDPFAEVRTLVNDHSPSLLVESSSFCLEQPGHFSTYFRGDVPLAPKEAQRAFTKEVKALGYETRKPQVWGGRPRILYAASYAAPSSKHFSAS